MLGIAAAIALLGTAACRDEKVERVECGRLGEELCGKWFSCRPVIAAGFWTDEETCVEVVKASCSNTETLAECDLDNSDLAECSDEIGDSECGSLPEVCADIAECST